MNYSLTSYILHLTSSILHHPSSPRQELIHSFRIDGTIFLLVVDADVRSLRGLEQLAEEVVDFDVVLGMNLTTERAGKGIREIDAKVAVVHVGLRRFL